MESVTPEALVCLLFEKEIVSKEEVDKLTTAGDIVNVLVEKGVLTKEDLEAHGKNMADFLHRIFKLIDEGKRISMEAQGA